MGPRRRPARSAAAGVWPWGAGRAGPCAGQRDCRFEGTCRVASAAHIPSLGATAQPQGSSPAPLPSVSPRRPLSSASALPLLSPLLPSSSGSPPPAPPTPPAPCLLPCAPLLARSSPTVRAGAPPPPPPPRPRPPLRPPAPPRAAVITARGRRRRRGEAAARRPAWVLGAHLQPPGRGHPAAPATWSAPGWSGAFSWPGRRAGAGRGARGAARPCGCPAALRCACCCWRRWRCR